MPSADDLFVNKYSLVKAAARRARHLQNGAPPLGVSKSLKACRVAQDEFAAGKAQLNVGRRNAEDKSAPPPAATL